MGTNIGFEEFTINKAESHGRELDLNFEENVGMKDEKGYRRLDYPTGLMCRIQSSKEFVHLMTLVVRYTRSLLHSTTKEMRMTRIWYDKMILPISTK